MHRKCLVINNDHGSEKLTYRKTKQKNTTQAQRLLTMCLFFKTKLARKIWWYKMCAGWAVTRYMNTTQHHIGVPLGLIVKKHDKNTQVREHDYKHRSTQFFEFSHTQSPVVFTSVFQSTEARFLVLIGSLLYCVWWFVFFLKFHWGMWLKCVTPVYFSSVVLLNWEHPSPDSTENIQIRTPNLNGTVSIQYSTPLNADFNVTQGSYTVWNANVDTFPKHFPN